VNDKLLENVDKSGVFHLPDEHRPAIEGTTARLDYHLLRVDLGQCRTGNAVLRKLGHALHFPAWYGANFDALFDCLSDPGWQPAKGHVLMITGIESLHLADPAACSTLIEVLAAAADARHATGKPCWILLDAALENVATMPEA